MGYIMDEEERKKSLAELEVKKKELSELRSVLDKLNVEKESWFDKKRQASREISELVGDIREAKGKRNNFTRQVKDSKVRRSELNSLLNQKKAEMHKLQQEKQDITRKFGIMIDPSKIKREIEQLEFRIETEALPFNIEQRMMKAISEKKKVLAQAKEAGDVFDKIHALGKEMDRIRLKADETHKKVQTKAETSQQFHAELVESSQEIKDLRAREEEALKKFVDLKTKYNEQNILVKTKFDEINAIKAKLDGINIDERKAAKKVEEQKLSEQKASVEEKIKRGLKLTTDDLLAFQAEAMSDNFNNKKQRRDKK